MAAISQAAFLACLLGTLLALPFSQARAISKTAGNFHSRGRALLEPAPTIPVEKYVWRVTVGMAAPDCFQRPVLLVNGELQPRLEVTQGSILEVTVINDLPAKFPSLTNGLAIHWHGFRMRGSFWYDGNGYTSQCPIPQGRNMTYRFQVNEPPGTYIWHSHSGATEADGLNGPLIVRPRPATPARYQYHGEHILHLSDWFHTASAAMAMPLNRPFDAAKVTNTSGAWNWVNNPQSLLLNGHGFYQDCAIGAGGSTVQPSCNVTTQWVAPGRSAQQPWASSISPGCSRQNFTVEAGKTYRFRIANAASLTYQTVCFGGHNVTVVEADARPVQPFQAQCVDVNVGQRYDVLLAADQPPDAYWISTHVQFRPGSPSGYGVLRYSGTDESRLPATPPPQPGSVAPWTLEMLDQLVMAEDVLEAAAAEGGRLGGVYEGIHFEVPREPDVRLLINLTQPLLEQTGQLRWALNNIADTTTPPCTPLAATLKRDPKWAAKHQVTPTEYNTPGYNTSNLGIQEWVGTRASVFISTPGSPTPSPIRPTSGTHLVPLKKATVVDVVVQNMPANANNGDYRPGGASRTAMEQHPFHLHGQHFWVMGSGLGNYSEATAELNTDDPPLRDTTTLLQGGWFVVRFLADNPGAWAFHCHITWHRLMGQGLTFVTAIDELPKPPAGLPKCPKTCTYSNAPWNLTYTREKYGASGFQIPAR